MEVKNEKEKIILGIGEIVWDIFPDGPRLGGAPANFVYYSQILGEKSILVSKVGNDELGKETLKQLELNGLVTDYVQIDENHPTGTVNVSLDLNGVPVFTIQENVAWDFLEKNDSLQALAQKAAAICFGSLAFRSAQNRETLNWFFPHLSSDCLRILDINLRPPFYSRQLIEWLFKMADILKINEQELEILKSIFASSSLEENKFLKVLLDKYKFKLIALTKGEKGSLLLTEKEEVYHPGFRVNVVDTVGAGDAFTAALVNGLLNNKSLEEINEKANRLASMVCSQKGAWVKIEI